MITINELTAGLAEVRPFIPIGILIGLLAWESFSPFFEFPRGGERLRHGGLNVLLGGANALLTGAVFVGLWWMTARWAEAHAFGLLNQVELPAALRLFAACLLFDAWMYLWHRLNHRIPFLWRFHRVHHSDSRMDVTTANRFHFGEIILSSLLRIPVIALLGLQMHEIAIYEILMFTVVQFHHANIALPEKLDRMMRWVIVTPFMHKVHHSRWQPETDSNFASLLSVWDRLFGSFRLNREPASLRFGLDEFEEAPHHSLMGMLRTPWARVDADGKAVDGGVRRALWILIPAALLVAGAWLVGHAMRPAGERIEAMKEKIGEEFPDVSHLPTADLAAWLNDPARPAPQIIDFRDAEDYAEGHIPQAIWIPHDITADALRGRFDPQRPVLVYCYVGRRSSNLAMRLKAAGWKHVMNLDGSFGAWQEEKRQIVPSAVDAPPANR